MTDYDRTFISSRLELDEKNEACLTVEHILLFGSSTCAVQLIISAWHQAARLYWWTDDGWKYVTALSSDEMKTPHVEDGRNMQRHHFEDDCAELLRRGTMILSTTA